MIKNLYGKHLDAVNSIGVKRYHVLYARSSFLWATIFITIIFTTFQVELMWRRREILGKLKSNVMGLVK